MKKLTNKLINLIALFALLSVYTIPIYARDVTKLSESEDAVIEGQKEYQQRCAICHGKNGKGDGPYSIALVYKPSDLTKLLVNNEGNFPFLLTYLIIDGRDMIKQHGTRLMPIWGDRYSQEYWSGVNPDYASTLVRGRIFELLLYLYSIQEPAY